jgi:hypothetical protein
MADVEVGPKAPSLERYGFRMGQRGNYAIEGHWYEFPSNDLGVLEIWTYTDKISYAPGEDVEFHVYTSAREFSLEIVRDGYPAETVHSRDRIRGTMPSTPDNAYEVGAGWPVAYTWTVPKQQRSGPYIATSRVRDQAGQTREHHHLFIVRPTRALPSAKLLMIFTSSTWIAYNEWGGANYYKGIAGQDRASWSPRLSTQRPWARGFVKLPEGAPHASHDSEVPPFWAAQIPFFCWAMGSGYSKWYVGGSYAEYDRVFVQWAEKQGFQLDYIAQHDLHYQSVDLSDYKAAIIVGHDEYWSTEMRDAVDAYIDMGGRVARFGANLLWQVRLEDGGRTQVCYKRFAHERDPVRDDPANRHRLTTIWDDQALGRPGVLTLGLNGSRGMYVRMGAMAPRHSGGFTVYRPNHWIFSETDLYYGDVFGSTAGIFGFEVDGLDYTFRHGLPYPTGADGAPVDNIEILAMGPAVMVEDDHKNPLSEVWWEDDDARVISRALFGDDSPENIDKIRYGSGMIVNDHRGRGEVVNAGSCMWVLGLRRREFFTEQITRNVLMRYSK